MEMHEHQKKLCNTLIRNGSGFFIISSTLAIFHTLFYILKIFFPELLPGFLREKTIDDILMYVFNYDK